MGCLGQPHYRVCLSTIYGCGLRLLEGVRLQVGDMDSGRRLLHVRGGKGNQDRYVPLPEQTLAQLRGTGSGIAIGSGSFQGRGWGNTGR